MTKLRVNAETIFSINNDYFFSIAGSDLVAATLKNVLKMLPGNSDEIKRFVKESDISLKKRDDLVKLTLFVNGLKYRFMILCDQEMSHLYRRCQQKSYIDTKCDRVDLRDFSE